VYVADKGNNSVTEVNMVSGRLIDVISQQGLSEPDGIAVEDGQVWVADSQSNAVTQINAGNDAMLRTFSDSDGPYGFGDPATVIAASGNVYVATPYGSSPMVTKVEATTGTPEWYMCNTNGPYYFSELSAFAVQGDNLWVASRTGANSQTPAAATGSLTEMNIDSGDLIATYPAPPSSTSTTSTTSTTTATAALP
jgi:outer membrane protein assembly factor BamB